MKLTEWLLMSYELIAEMPCAIPISLLASSLDIHREL